MSDTESNPDLTRIQDEGTPRYIPATAYAKSWACKWTDPSFGILTETDMKLFRHVNCSYLSSGTPPTLLALKQHAQSLANLIKKVCLSESFGIIDGRERRPAFQRNETFDWLKNLDEPYTNDDKYHHLPLWVLANHVEGEDDVSGLEFHCPLKPARDFGPLAPEDGLVRPYRTHHNLVMHANACLEILDHEYSATGGIMSLLPSEKEEDSEELEGARNTLLGQWLLHHQHLVARLHELEISHANALDLLAGEAAVPMQMLGRYGPDGRANGREVAYPQDRFVLANAGDDVIEKIHHALDKSEVIVDRMRQESWNSGTDGERMWVKTLAGEWLARDLVFADLKTRFCRLKEQGRNSTIFILPAIEHHPAVAHTLKVENRPTVVSVVTPTWPQRVSDLEQRYRDRLKQGKEADDANRSLTRENIDLKDSVETLSAELRRTKMQLRFYEGTSGADSQDELLDALQMYESKLQGLRQVLPREYHKHLEMDLDRETEEGTDVGRG